MVGGVSMMYLLRRIGWGESESKVWWRDHETTANWVDVLLENLNEKLDGARGASVTTKNTAKTLYNLSTANTIQMALLHGRGRPSALGFVLPPALPTTVFSQLPQVLTMATKSKPPKGRDGTISSLNVAIEALNLAKEISGIAPAKAAFGSVSALLAMIRVPFPIP